MRTKTNEAALEALIERTLTGSSQEERKANTTPTETGETPQPAYRSGNGFWTGFAADFNAEYAIDTRRFWHFLETTQAEELDKLREDSGYKRRILERLHRMVKKYGILRVLRKGLEIDDAHFTLLYTAPLPSSSLDVRQKFESNEFSVTRQVRYSLDKPLQEIDMAVFVNGLPLMTIELKNPWTGQTAAVHGQKQYKRDRDEKQTLLQFGRCMVHLAVDTDEVYMTTRLRGKATYFLPFNQGNNYGKGNPVNPMGHRTAYLWQEILTRESLANIIQHFVRFDGKPTDALSKRTLFFPRYHQMEVVRKIIKHASENGTDQTYLIQHSAGSGKSNSITWAAYQLIETYPIHKDLPGSKGIDTPLFDSVIVVTDRRLLDKQIRENIKEFSQVKNIVAPAFSSKELRSSLEQGKKIIITTIQKFPFIVEGIADLSDKRFAVIIDEAHSSQSGSAADNMNRAMGNKSIEEDEEMDAQDLILKVMQERKMRGNASYLAFTATPKSNTLEKFGTRQEDGSFEPFHKYSMKQAIEEGFILDVLANYTTYRSYYEIKKSIETNPEFGNLKAQKKLRAYVESHRETINTKAEIMIEHFLSKTVATKKLKGKAKGMIITQNIPTAVRYFQAVKRILIAKGQPFNAIIAFSGKKVVDGIEYSEDSINGFPGKDIKDKFDTDEYRLLVVANKFLTGFDQPKLSAMYVDKKLQGVLAVQALSRLNRSAQKYGKKTEDLFILDFFNNTGDIQAAFAPYYTATTLREATDINVLHELKEEMDMQGVYEWSEVEQFCDLYFRGVDAEEISPLIETAAERFNKELDFEHEDKADFKIKAKQFVKIYGQAAAIMRRPVVRWEQLFWFLKFLIPKLVIPRVEGEEEDDLLNSVDLSTYGLERTHLNETIKLEEEEGELDPQNANPRGVHGGGEDEKDPLDLIINAFNERHFSNWNAAPEEQKVIIVSVAKHIRQNKNYQKQVVENPDKQNRDIAYQKIFEETMREHRKQMLEMYKLQVTDAAFKQGLMDMVGRVLDIDNRSEAGA